MKSTATLRAFLLGSSAILAAPTILCANTLYWDGGTVEIGTDGNGLSNGTTGDWNTSLANWDVGASPHVAWDNTNTLLNPADTAVFGISTVAGNTVTLLAPISVGGLRFYNTGYTIAAGVQGLTFGGTNNSIRLFGSTGTTASAAITGTVTGANPVVVTSVNPAVLGTMTFSGISAGGWSGSTTINASTTAALAVSSQALLETSGIFLNGGTILLTNTATGSENTINRVHDTSAIASYGTSTISIANTAVASRAYTETIGAITHYNGQLSIGFVTNQNQSLNTQTLILGGLTRSGSTSTIAVSGGGSGAASINGNSTIQVNGVTTSTTAGEIIGPWLTTGSIAGTQSDWGKYTSDGTNAVITSTAIGQSSQSTWSSSWAAGSNYTLDTTVVTNPDRGRLTGDRMVNTLRTAQGDSAPTSVNSTSDYITMTNGFADGDVVLSRNSTGGLTQGRVYYVINKDVNGVNTFQVSLTPGGSVVDLTNITAGFMTSGVNLNGNTLGTYGILTGSTSIHGIGGPAGSKITLPTTTAGNLYLQASASTLWIDVPITNNDPLSDGSGVLTLVKGGTSTLTLNGTNTYTGGTVVNAGTLVFNTAGSWVNNQNLTFGGTGTIQANTAITGGALTVNQGAVCTIVTSSTATFTTTSGSGTLVANPSSSSGIVDLGDASGFIGNLLARMTGNLNVVSTSNNQIQFTDIDDTVGSALQFSGGTSDSGQVVRMALYGNGGQLTFDNRQIQLLPRTGSNWNPIESGLINNNTNAAHTWVINTDLLMASTSNTAGAAGVRYLALGGSNSGDNAFNGLLMDGDNGSHVLGLRKTGVSKWIVSDNNTFTGGLQVTGGELTLSGLNEYTGQTSIQGNSTVNVNTLKDFGTASSLGKGTSGTVIAMGGGSTTLNYTGSGDTTDRTFSFSNGVSNTYDATINNNGAGALIFSAAAFNAATAIGGTTKTYALTLGGTYTGGTNEIQGVIQNSGGVHLTSLAVSGGTWKLSGANSYTGATTTLNAGVLQAIDGVGLPTNTILELRGGVFQSSGSFSRNVTTAAGGVNWSTSSGGFAARGGTLNLQLNGGTSSLTWNGSSFVSTGQSLIFGSTSADSLVNFQNSINLGSSGANTRTITVIDNPGSATDLARISGNLTNTAAGHGLLKDGGGTLELTGTNTYTGATAVSQGTLALVGGSQTSAITVASGASLGFTLSSPTTSTAAVTLTTGTVKITGIPDGSSDYTLMTLTGGSTFSGTPALNSPISGYVLQLANTNTELVLVHTGGASPYDTWAAGTFAHPFTDKAPAHDFDMDGLTNLQEYGLGTDPTDSTSGSIVWANGGAVTNPGLPVAFDFSSGGGVDYRAVFGRRKDYVAAGLTYTVQFSSNMTDWTDSGVTPTVLTSADPMVNPSEIEAVSVPYPLFVPVTTPVAGSEKPTFLRIGVSQ